MRGAIHHLDLTVRDPRASHGFYAAVLGFMGYREVADHDRGYDYDRVGPDGFCSIGIMKAQGPNAGRAHDRYSPGLHHVAWMAERNVAASVSTGRTLFSSRCFCCRIASSSRSAK